MRTLWGGVLAAAVAFPLVPAPAQDPPDPVQELLAGARDRAKAGEVGKAADLFGEAIALAQKHGKLLEEQEAAEAFLRFLDGLPSAPPKPEGGRESAPQAAGRLEALAGVLSKLDPKRCGAFVSAPCIAGDLLLLGVERGDTRFVDRASATLAMHAGAGNSGQGLATLAKLGAALNEKVRNTDPELVAVYSTAVQEGWIDVAMAAGIERAARAAVRPGEEAAAKAAVGKVAELVTPKTAMRLCAWARAMVEHRLRGAPADVLAPFRAAWEAREAAAGPGAAAEDGGNATVAGADLSPLGQALRKPPRDGVLATLARTKDGIDFRVSWDPKFRRSHRFQDGVRHLDTGGLTVSVLEWSVALRMTDPTGADGQPGASAKPDPGRAFYRLARGEAWRLMADGVVAVGK